ncbi:unnamed protein product [Calypogeia fissa]
MIPRSVSQEDSEAQTGHSLTVPEKQGREGRQHTRKGHSNVVCPACPPPREEEETFPEPQDSCPVERKCLARLPGCPCMAAWGRSGVGIPNDPAGGLANETYQRPEQLAGQRAAGARFLPGVSVLFGRVVLPQKVAPPPCCPLARCLASLTIGPGRNLSVRFP